VVVQVLLEAGDPARLRVSYKPEFKDEEVKDKVL